MSQGRKQDDKKPTDSDLSNIDNGLAKVLALRPVSWNWKEAGTDTEVQYGFIAQDVEKIVPSAVSDGTRHDGTVRKFLTTSDLVPFLVGAIQDQQKQINALERALKQLQTKPPKPT